MTQIKDSTRNTRCRQTLRAGPVSSTQRKSPPEHKGGGSSKPTLHMVHKDQVTHNMRIKK